MLACVYCGKDISDPKVSFECGWCEFKSCEACADRHKCPGWPPAKVSRLIAAMGSQRERYQSATEIQQYSGIAPVLASSGKLHWVHWRWACPKFLRQTFHEWALHSIAYSDWARQYYE